MGLIVDRMVRNLVSFDELEDMPEALLWKGILRKGVTETHKKAIFAPSDKNMGKHNLIRIDGESNTFEEAIDIYSELCDSCAKLEEGTIFPFLPKILDDYIIQIDTSYGITYFFVHWVSDTAISITTSVRIDGKRKNVSNTIFDFIPAPSDKQSKNPNITVGLAFYNIYWISSSAYSNIREGLIFEGVENLTTNEKYAMWVLHHVFTLSCYVFTKGIDSEVERKISSKSSAGKGSTNRSRVSSKSQGIKIRSGKAKRVVYDYSKDTPKKEYAYHKTCWYVRGYFQHFGKPGNQVVKYVSPRINTRKSGTGKAKSNNYFIE